MSSMRSHSSTAVNDLSRVESQVERARELYPGPEEKLADPFLVEFEPGDPEYPMNWSRLKRWYLTFLGGMLVLNATFASSAPSGVVEQISEQFGFSREVATLTISLFLTGYCLGPIVWGPLSESFGRRPIFVVSFVFYTGFQVGCALSQNTASILIFRLLGGTFAAAPLTNSGALISDMWDARTRGKALAAFTLAPFAGPALGPLVGGYIGTAGVSWRWLFWVLTMFAGVCTIILFFTLPETYAPILLVKKAEKLRKETGDSRYHAPLEKEESKPWATQLNHILAKPFKVLVQEPMLIALTVYMSFVYGCVYLLFEAYPIVFGIGHHFSAGATGLMFLPIFLGGCVACLVYLLVFNPKYERLIERYSPDPVPPEHRLELALYGAPLFMITFFWFGWTSYPSISFWSPMMSGITMGWAVTFIFLALINYIIDAYLFVAASALAANTIFRSIAGAGFPLFATQMYEALNPRWASTLLGLIALVLLPIPFALVKFGPTLRKRSKHARSPVATKLEEEESL